MDIGSEINEIKKKMKKYMTKGEKYKLYNAIVNKNLWFVHSIDTLDIENLINDGRELYFNLSDFLDSRNLLLFPQRIEFNNSIGHFVQPFSIENNWDCRKYIFVAPMIEYIGELLVGNIQDYITVGNHKYSKESYLLVPNNELSDIQKKLPNLESTIIGYDYPEEFWNKETGWHKQGSQCFNELKKLLRSSKKKTPPREAVINLFHELRENKDIDVYTVDEDMQYANSTTYEPIIRASDRDYIDDEQTDLKWGKLRDKSGNLHNINIMLNSLYPIEIPDSSSFHDLVLLINQIKKYVTDPKKLIKAKILSSDDHEIIDPNEWLDAEGPEKLCSGLSPSNPNPIYKILYKLINYRLDVSSRSDYLSKLSLRLLNKVEDKIYNLIIFCEIMKMLFTLHPDIIDYGDNLIKYMENNEELSDIYWNVYLNSPAKSKLAPNFKKMSQISYELCIHSVVDFDDWDEEEDLIILNEKVKLLESLQKINDELITKIVDNIAISIKY